MTKEKALDILGWVVLIPCLPYFFFLGLWKDHKDRVRSRQRKEL